MIDTSRYEEYREIMHNHKRNHRMRFILLVFALTMSIFMQIYEYVKVVENYRGFFLCVGAVVFTIGALTCALFASAERPKLVFALLTVLALGIGLHYFNELLGGLLFLVYLTEIPECRKAGWLMRQDGYPYFSERFEEQKLHPDFRPDHKLDGKAIAVMPDIDVPDQQSSMDTDVEAAIQEMRRRRQQKTDRELKAAQAGKEARKQYDIRPGETADVMPGIVLRSPEEIEAESTVQTEKKLPLSPAPPSSSLSVPELPREEEIPLPVWDVPDPSFPDPVTDTSVILSGFPDIAGDIPDLPEIPDIPTL